MVAMLGWAVPARAEIGTIDNVPAATLLVPYFEVDLNDTANGANTLISINNASASAVLAHVTIWSDLSVEMLNFIVYLTGYDVQTISLRDIIVFGNLPQTASVGQDPQGANIGVGISPRGIFSTDINFASCNGILPYPNLNAIDPRYLPHLQQGLTGGPSPIYEGQCTAQNLGDNIARGYITVDTVSACTVLTPADPTYFVNGGLGIATNQNVLWGDVFYTDELNNFAQGETVVHVEASPGLGLAGTGTYLVGDPRTTTPGRYTFYGRYNNWTAADNREPLATTFAARFLNGGAFSGGTNLLVWRDSKVNQGPFTCGTLPAWFPLSLEGLVVFDEREQPSLPPFCRVSPCPPEEDQPFGAETQRTQVGGPDLPVPFAFGWLYLNLNQTNAFQTLGLTDPTVSQAWVSQNHDANGRFSVGYSAIQLDNASLLPHPHFTPGGP
jgi:hypothetical protein